MSKHTPTPWTYEHVEYSDGYYTTVFNNSNIAICDITGPNAEANAAFIVRAVNAHDELVAALESVDRLWKEDAQLFPEEEMGLDTPVGKVWSKVTAALLKAKA